MEPKVNYFTVGLFVIGLTAAFIAGVLLFSLSQHKAHNTYVVYMKESVSGLSVQAPVKFNGVDVGYVSDIQLDPLNPQQVVLMLAIEEGTPIDQSTKATLMTQGITGVMFIGLKAGATTAPPLEVQPGQKYPVIASTPSLLRTLSDMLADVSGSFKQISAGMEELLSKDNQRALRRTLDNMSTITQTFADRSQELDQSIKDFGVALQDSQTALQGFSQQLMPGMVQSLNQLNGILNNVEPFTNNLKNNPSILIRGKAPAAPGPGE